MRDLRKAAEMALEALEWNYGTDLENIENCMAWLDKMNATIPALRQALAQPEQEPVAGMFEEKLPDQNPPPWMRHKTGGPDDTKWEAYIKAPSVSSNEDWISLYTAPPNLEAAVLAEREACLKEIAIELEEWNYGTNANIALNNVYAAIRARGEK